MVEAVPDQRWQTLRLEALGANLDGEPRHAGLACRYCFKDAATLPGSAAFVLHQEPLGHEMQHYIWLLLSDDVLSNTSPSRQTKALRERCSASNSCNRYQVRRGVALRNDGGIE